jgi:hypothetical protein
MRFFWLFTLAAAGLATLCVATAVYLFQEQTRFHSVFRDNVASRKAAVEMEKTLAGLIAPEDRAEPVSVLRESAEKQLNEMAKHADESEEKEQYEEMTSGFEDYLKQWDRLPSANSAEYASKRAEIAQLLKDRVLKPCREFRLHAGKNHAASFASMPENNWSKQQKITSQYSGVWESEWQWWVDSARFPDWSLGSALHGR